MANTRFIDAQRVRFEKSKVPVLSRRAKAIEKFTQLAKEFKLEIQYYDSQLASIDAAIRALEVPIEEVAVRDELNDTTLTQGELIVDEVPTQEMAESASTPEVQAVADSSSIANETPVWSIANDTSVMVSSASMSETSEIELPSGTRDEMSN